MFSVVLNIDGHIKIFDISNWLTKEFNSAIQLNTHGMEHMARGSPEYSMTSEIC